EHVPLALAQPYVSELANLTVREGELQVDGKLALAPQGPETKLSFNGDLALEGLRTLDNTLREDLIGFARLEVKHVAYTSLPQSLDIERVTLRRPYARVVLSAKQELNVVSVLKPPAAAAPSAAPQQTEGSEPEPGASEPRFPLYVHTIAFEQMRLN